MQRREFLKRLASAAALPSLSNSARAETYPARPVHIIVGFPPGAASDINARLIGEWLSQRLGQQFIIDNRPGAGSNVGTEAAVHAPADGYTLLLVSSANAVNATLYGNLSYNFIRDIAPVAGIMRVPNVMVVNPSVPAKTVPEFIAYAKANPGKINMATAGNGSTPHITGELFKEMAGVDLVPVAYRGGGPALIDLLAGQMQVMLASLPSSIEYIKAGKLRPLGVTTVTRLELLPDIPPIADFVPGFEVTSWTGIGAPKGSPSEIIDKLNKAINAALSDPRIKARFADLGGAVLPGSPADFGKLIADDTEKWAKVVKFANIKPE